MIVEIFFFFFIFPSVVPLIFNHVLKFECEFWKSENWFILFLFHVFTSRVSSHFQVIISGWRELSIKSYNIAVIFRDKTFVFLTEDVNFSKRRLQNRKFVNGKEKFNCLNEIIDRPIRWFYESRGSFVHHLCKNMTRRRKKKKEAQKYSKHNSSKKKKINLYLSSISFDHVHKRI